MSSYNNIRKIKYTKNPTDVVSLQEYIIFEDSHAKEKFVVFRFSNNVNQRLFEIKFEVSQYNADNELIEKSVVVHSDFVAEANDLFVPNAKLKVNFGCESLEVRLEMASFDRVLWSEGEFTDNSYRFDTYAETVAKESKTQQVTQKTKADSSPSTKNKVKRNKLGFNISSIFRKNKATFPAVFNVILCIVLIGLVIASTFYFKSVTGAYSVDGFIVKESDGYITVLLYTGDDENVEIPSQIDERYVAKIADGAFVGNTVKNVFINVEKPLTIETGAFNGCSSLETVTSADYCAKVTVMEGAFKNCKSLNVFAVSSAELSKGSFYQTSAIQSLIFYRPVFTEGRLLDIFSGGSPRSFTYYFNTSAYSVPAGFFEGLN